jgi:SAM-dependent methyltransferase
MTSHYDRQFYNRNSPGSAHSAAKVVPFVISLVGPNSVADIGCGTGTWTAEFARHGVTDVLGIDGAHVGRSLLEIAESSFLQWDLERPVRLERTFDLAISMEVAEHLSPGRACSFVDDLTGLAPVVLFSAAIPGQGGVGHINEQWPSYWARIFAERGFRAVDRLRAQFWDDAEVESWYRQNMLLFVREDRAQAFSQAGRPGPLDIVHPELYSLKSVVRPNLGLLLRLLPGAMARPFWHCLCGAKPASLPSAEAPPQPPRMITAGPVRRRSGSLRGTGSRTNL